jgi:hypothetical protein
MTHVKGIKENFFEKTTAMRFCSEEETLFHFGYNKDK